MYMHASLYLVSITCAGIIEGDGIETYVNPNNNNILLFADFFLFVKVIINL